jgi:membrane-bound serine protease (ClpP class)
MEGVVLTPLRPAGTALIGGRRIDVLSADGFVEAQERVKIVQVEGAKVTVRKAIDLAPPHG